MKTITNKSILKHIVVKLQNKDKTLKAIRGKKDI